MSDYRNIRRYIEGLSDDDFCKLRAKLGYEIIDCGEFTIEILLDEPECQRPLPVEWRKTLTDEMLEWRENTKSEWNNLCWILGVETDSSHTLRLGRVSVCISFAALLISAWALMGRWSYPRTQDWAVRWLLGAFISLGVGTLFSWLTWLRIHAYVDNLTRKHQWKFEEGESERGKLLPWLTGVLERAFFMVLVAFDVSGVGGTIGSWIIVKMVTGWNRITKAGLQYRTIAFAGLLCTLVSLFFGVLGGLVAGGRLPPSTPPCPNTASAESNG